ncbi:MAG TPA: L-threonylcarbamoyladenylate synthase, partial [Anaeromyxobacteraceae bacterium]|nr:L-threonylcarbamoyladenylate synthase [Anaeromyxobacteraceae bacterium]
MARAAALLRAGGLVAFPTETVYGLGALALEPLAVRAIYAAKGRPATNPLIVHVPGVADARALVAEWPVEAERLAARFWPGPLTLVLPRAASVPDEVTAGGSTVAVRAPGHPVAQALLAALGAPVAAPSANRSEHVSPTRAEHVLADLEGRIDAVVDGGPCAVGIESTVLWIAGGRPRVLRPGVVGRREIEEVIGPLDEPSSSSTPSSIPSSSPSPTSTATASEVVRPERSDATASRSRRAPSSSPLPSPGRSRGGHPGEAGAQEAGAGSGAGGTGGKAEGCG